MADKKLIWDLPVRLIHWLLVILIAWSWYAVEINDDLETHMLLGYCILTLIIFRIAWGVVGTRYARFGSFIFSLREILNSGRKFFSRQYGDYAGHNRQPRKTAGLRLFTPRKHLSYAHQAGKPQHEQHPDQNVLDPGENGDRDGGSDARAKQEPR